MISANSETLPFFPFLDSLRVNMELVKSDRNIQRMMEHKHFELCLPQLLSTPAYKASFTEEKWKDLDAIHRTFQERSRFADVPVLSEYDLDFHEGSFCGRLYPHPCLKNDSKLMFHYMPKVYRENVAHYLGGADIDMEKCHPSLIVAILRDVENRDDIVKNATYRNELKALRSNLEQYVADPQVYIDECIKALTPASGVPNGKKAIDKGVVKLVINSIAYGGNPWVVLENLKNGVECEFEYDPELKERRWITHRLEVPYAVGSDATWPAFIAIMESGMKVFRTVFYDVNKDILGQVLDKEKHKEKVLKKDPDAKDWKIEKKLRASFLSEILQHMECYIISACLYSDLAAVSNVKFTIPLWDGGIVFSELHPEDLVYRLNQFVEGCGVRFSHKAFSHVSDAIQEEIKKLVANWDGIMEDPRLDGVLDRQVVVGGSSKKRKVCTTSVSYKRRKEMGEKGGCGKGEGVGMDFAGVNQEFKKECIYLEKRQQFIVKKQPDQYGRRLWSDPFSNERKLLTHFKDWVYDLQVPMKDGDSFTIPTSFIQEKLNPLNTFPFHKRNDVVWLPRKDTPFVGNDVNIFEGFQFDGYVRGPRDQNWNDDAIEVLKKQLRETFELEEGETVNEEGFSPNALIFLDSWTALANHPEKKLGFMIFLLGNEGTGKTKLLEFLVNCFGREYLTTAKSNMEDVTGQFNGHLDRKLILNIPEPEAGVGEATLRAIMNLVTDQSVSTERKNVQKGDDPINYVHVYACINKLSAAFDSGDILQRRWRVIRVNQSLKDDREHCDKIDNYHQAGNVYENRYALASLFWWLQNRTMTVNFNTIPDAPRMVKAAEDRQAPAVMFFLWLKRKLITERMQSMSYTVQDGAAMGSREVGYTVDHLWKMYEAWFKATYESNQKMQVGNSNAFANQFAKVASIYIPPANGVDEHPENLKFIRKDQVDLRSIGGGRKMAYFFDFIDLFGEVLNGRRLVARRVTQNWGSSVYGVHNLYVECMEDGHAEYSPLQAVIDEITSLARDQYKHSVSELALVNGVPSRAYEARQVSLPIVDIR